MSRDSQRPVRIGVQVKPQHADIWNALLPDAESYERKSRLL